MTEANMKAADAILAQQKKAGAAPSWGVAEHCACLSNRILTVVTDWSEAGGAMDDEADIKALKGQLRSMLATDGIGGNSSQFRQALVKAEKLPKSAAETLNAYE